MKKHLLFVLLMGSNVQAFGDFSAVVEYVGDVKSVAPMTITVENDGKSRNCQLPCEVGSDDAFTNTTPDTIALKMKVELSSDAEVTLTPKTKMHFEKIDDRITPVLDAGVTHIDVPEADSKEKKFRFFIKTKSAVMGVRGTEFVIEETESGETKLNTLKGEVGMAKDINGFKEEAGKSPKWIRVSEGNAGLWKRGESQIKEVRQFNTAQFRKQLKERHSGFMKAIEKRQEVRREKREAVRAQKERRGAKAGERGAGGSRIDGRQERSTDRRRVRDEGSERGAGGLYDKSRERRSGKSEDIHKIREQFYGKPKFERRKESKDNYLQKRR